MDCNEKVAVFTGTRNIYKSMETSAKSLIANSDVDTVWFFTEDDEFPYDIPKDIIKVRNVSGQTYFRPDGPNMKKRYTYMALMRATLAMEFPELDKIASFDSDIVAVEDVSDLWDFDVSDGYYRAFIEPSFTEKRRYTYANMGVCLFNLEKLRDGKCVEVIEAVNKDEYQFMEEEAFNVHCQGMILPLPMEYNMHDFQNPHPHPKIIHYAGSEKWDFIPLFKKWETSNWDEILRHRKRKYGK